MVNLIDSQEYKDKVKANKPIESEDVWRFAFDDLRNENIIDDSKVEVLTRKELYEILVDHTKKTKSITLQNKSCRSEEEKRLFVDSDRVSINLNFGINRFIKIFPIFKFTQEELAVKLVYLIPNIEFSIIPIKPLQIVPSKVLASLEPKIEPDDSLDILGPYEKYGFITINEKSKITLNYQSEVKSKPISGVWIYDDSTSHKSKSKLNLKKHVHKA